MSQYTSLSSVERDNPPPRRKACAGCIKAKRRCDLGLPACTRCAQRRIACQYTSTPATSLPHSSFMPSGPTYTQIQGLGLPLDGQPSPAWTEAPSITPVDQSTSGSSQDFSFNDLDSLNYVDWDTSNTTLDELLEPGALSCNTPAELVAKTLRRPNIGISSDYDVVAVAVQTRLAYGIEQIMAAPKMMVLESQTPWCHPLLYRNGMPRSMQGRPMYLYRTPHLPLTPSLRCTFRLCAVHCKEPSERRTHKQVCEYAWR